MLDHLIKRGLLTTNTLVIVTADHGEEFNEHGTAGHGQTLYTQAVRVPLLTFDSGEAVRAARVIAGSHLDTTETLCNVTNPQVVSGHNDIPE